MPSNWQEALSGLFDDYLLNNVFTKVSKIRESGTKVFPEDRLIFNALEKTGPNQVKILLLGQDPYPTAGNAHGLSFSVEKQARIPHSLKNIFLEIESDIGTKPESTNLSHWAEQGVLLLNSILTVNEGEPLSHKKLGWEELTDTIIKYISDNNNNVVFMLWGNFAKQKNNLIDSQKHLILTAPHPSPLSSYRGFFGCKHFTLANQYLKDNNKKPIIWQ